MKGIRFFFSTLTICALIVILLPMSAPPILTTIDERVRKYTRMIEFDYVSWTIDALFTKQAEAALNAPQYLSPQQQHDTVIRYLKLVGQIDSLESEIQDVYTDPNVPDPKTSTAEKAQQLSDLKAQWRKLGPLAEQIIQQQVSATVKDMGLTLLGQPIPPILYHVTPLPYALIISPRDVVRQDADISLLPDMTIQQMVDLENQVEKEYNVSALVEEIGGVGVYPTMVADSTNFPWQLETVSHEWTHNFLTWHPLGISYFSNEDMRTINETTANLSGKEIGQEVLRRYYPEFLPKPAPATPPPDQGNPNPPAEQPPQPPPFDFNKEMHTTRVQVDLLLSQGKIDEAESYMEQRRKIFWDNGYHLRKINQAYFAFHGAYADIPGGAAGEDPIGPTVVKLRDQSTSLADFLNKIAWVTSFDQLKSLVH